MQNVYSTTIVTQNEYDFLILLTVEINFKPHKTLQVS